MVIYLLNTRMTAWDGLSVVRWRVKIRIWIVCLHLTTLLRIIWLKPISLLVLVNIRWKMLSGYTLTVCYVLIFDICRLIDCVCVFSLSLCFSSALLYMGKLAVITAVMAAVTFRHAHGYIPGRTASPPFGWYQIKPLGHRDSQLVGRRITDRNLAGWCTQPGTLLRCRTCERRPHSRCPTTECTGRLTGRTATWSRTRHRRPTLVASCTSLESNNSQRIQPLRAVWRQWRHVQLPFSRRIRVSRYQNVRMITDDYCSCKTCQIVSINKPTPSPTNSIRAKEKNHIPWTCSSQAQPGGGVFQSCLWPLKAPGYLGRRLPRISSAFWRQYPTCKHGELT